MSAWRLASAGACLLAGLALPGPAPAAPADNVGRSIYLRGVLGSGPPLEGTREAGVVTTGADAACVNCHQRSGLGSVEGSLSIPPVTGEYLFHSRAHDASEPVLPYVESLHGNRDPYTDATLARAIREGLDSQGRPLNYLMPRFALGDEDMAALVEYLKTLSVRQVPGVTDTVLHFATISTPDADPLKRRGMLDVLEQFFVQKNLFPLKPSPRMLTSGKTQYSKSMYMANRHWQLHVWELTGPAASWRAQLDKHLAAEPVYAVLSGLAGSNWAPVHEFCEQNAIPCLFPNVEVPVIAERDFYSLYFSKGVLLEAQLIARTILGPDNHPTAGAVEQVYRAGDSGEPAAKALAAQLKGHGVTVHSTVLTAGAQGHGVTAVLRAAALRKDARGQALVLWLRPGDIAALSDVPAGAATVYLSGRMGGLEKSPLPAGWREHTLMTYPFDLPGRRGVRLDYPLGWFSFRHIPVVAEQVQTDTYLACSLLADVLNRMADNFARPYLIEQLQALLEHRIITGYYPHLTLASNQRFASKGGYVVHFRDPGGTALVAEADWIVP
ncbi:MAG: cytochrome c [Deltaproteobacteria bacterium]|nr:MAG: cytochrome c [Deltaproteobacteria bacterium]